MQTRIFLLAFFVITSWSCKKTKVITTGFNNSAKVIATIIGSIEDENGSALSDALVEINNIKYITTESGFFNFNKIQIKELAQLVSVTKEGYFSAFRTIHSKYGGNSNIVIKMIKKENPIIFQSQSGALVSKNELELLLPSRGYKNKISGAPYSGEIRVFVAPILTHDDDFLKKIPGDLRGLNSNNNLSGLASFGMVTIELEDPLGNPLQIGKDEIVTIKMPIANTQLSTAPTDIPLWYFDSEKSLWVEEGKAKKVGNKYEGMVKHFSTWAFNISNGLPPVNFSVRFMNNLNLPLLGCEIRLKALQPVFNGGGWLNYDGDASGDIMSNTSYLLELIPFTCNSAIYTTTFASTTANVNLGTITIPNLTTVSGSINDCNNNPIANNGGFLFNGGPATPFLADGLGNFSFCISNCNLPYFATIIIPSSTLNYGDTSVALSAGTNNLGSIRNCGYRPRSISCTITNQSTGKVYSLFGTYHGPLIPIIQPLISKSTLSNGITNINGGVLSDNLANGEVYLDFDGNGTSGIHNLTFIHFTHRYTPNANNSTVTTIFHANVNIPINIISYSSTPNIGFVSGSFNGTFMAGGFNHNLQGSFNTQRGN
jgi:hypothetical protein